jgi:arylformamidase
MLPFMRLIDLSHTISSSMPVYPGTEPPEFTYPCQIDEVGFNETLIKFYSHTGTHLDAPAHILSGGRRLDEISIDRFVGRCRVLDLTGIGKSVIEIRDLEARPLGLDKNGFILLNTGWSRMWGKGTYFRGYPTLSVQAAEWLAGFELKGLGIDAISVDAEGSTSFPVHKIFLERDILIIENLTNLDSLPNEEVIFSCLPLKIEAGEGSPVRAVGILCH